MGGVGKIILSCLMLPVPAMMQIAEEADDTLLGAGTIAGLRDLERAKE